MFCVAKMWLCLLLWRLSTLLLVAGTLDFNFFTQKRQYVPSMQMNCYEYPKFNTERMASVLNGGYRLQRSAMKRMTSHPLQRRDIHIAPPRSFQQVLNFKGDIYKEHAKLVQDINSLKQVVLVAPLADDTREYDESVFHEIIETSTTTSPLPHIVKTINPSKLSSIPVILAGSSSNAIRQIPKSQQFINFPKSTVNLVGTTLSPLRHPYPYVMKNDPTSRPMRICMLGSTAASYANSGKTPSLLQRLINAIIPR